METKTDLNPNTVDAIQELIATNLDSEKQLKTCAEDTEDNRLQGLFRRVGDARHTHATELQGYVKWNGENPEDDGSFFGAARKSWIDLRNALSGNDKLTILKQAEAAEDVIKHRYEELIKDTAGSAMNDVLLRQYREVKKHHDLIRDLRDAEAA